ncbi:P-loop containing nucleoside triphosphate hydrolase protein [Globomyces pollinis-pini]|nr:P-loop containing nucleoside triphosphate hydrolase protein [Globomyces pollinis-pini]
MKSESSLFSEKSRQLIDASNKLRDLGVDSQLPIPGVVVVGNQSAGKSSLIEAIARIPLPRSDGTCTRCPMECRLSEVHDQPWKCKVSLRFDVTNDNEPLSKPHDQPFGGDIFDVNEVEERLKRAQKAILNPSISVDNVLSTHDLDLIENEIEFTRNVVCIEISGPGVGVLTVIDLPGIISNTENKKDRKYINLIRDMCTYFMKQKNMIIVECLTCKDDIANQSVHSIARETDPEGMRTVGVLTKPDTIEANCYGPWQDLMVGNSHSLHHGYFMVLNPKKSELEQSIKFGTARKNESKYFKTVSPWNSYHIPKNKLGVNNLKIFLSELLADMMEQELPGMIETMESELSRLERELESLPKKVENPQFEFNKLIISFYRTVENSLQESEFECAERSIYEKFKLEISATNFHIAKKNEDGEQKVYDLGDHAAVYGWDLEELKVLIESKRAHDIPGFLTDKVPKQIIKESLVSWKDAYTKCIRNINDLIQKKIDFILKKDGFSRSMHLTTRSGIAFVLTTRVETERFLHILKTKGYNQVDGQYRSELQIVTLNTPFAVKSKEKYEKTLRRLLQEHQFDCIGDLSDSLAALASAGFAGITENDLKTLQDLGSRLSNWSTTEITEANSLIQEDQKLSIKRAILENLEKKFSGVRTLFMENGLM